MLTARALQGAVSMKAHERGVASRHGVERQLEDGSSDEEMQMVFMFKSFVK